jgi:hypothetical protein
VAVKNILWNLIPFFSFTESIWKCDDAETSIIEFHMDVKRRN